MKKRTPDIRKLARRQRWILWLVLASVLSQFLMFMPLGGMYAIVHVIVTLLWLASYVLMIVGVVLLLTARGSHVLIIILCGILMVAPCANLLLLLLVNMGVTRTLRRAGLHVGFMGVKEEQLERVLRDDLCTACGYNLTGNVSGVCSECGTTIPSS